VNDLIESRFSIHYHVWTDQDLRDIIDYTMSTLRLAWSPKIFWCAHFYRKEAIVLLRKSIPV
jgi:hypothetical protein